MYCLFKSYTSKHKQIKSGNILIIEGGHIGDALMDAPALIYLADYYVADGKNVYFLCSQSAWYILKQISSLSGVKYVGQNYSYDFKDFNSFWKVEAELRQIEFERIIGIATGDGRVDCLAGVLRANQKWGIAAIGASKGIKVKLYNHLRKCYYSDIIIGDRNQFQLRHFVKLMRELKIEGFKIMNASIPPHSEYKLPTDSYITISTDSSTSEKSWPVENYVELITQLLKCSDDNIILIGKSIDSNLQKKIASASELGSKRIINMVGKTTLAEWIEIIRGSKFLIGVDSGSIHVAAAVGTLAFCLSGVWSGHKCIPYDIDYVAPGTKLPICIYRQDTDIDYLPCYDCRGSGRPGYGNAECLAQCKSGQPCLCLSEITPDDVMEAIHHAKEIGAIS